jgi:hypothetical protein
MLFSCLQKFNFARTGGAAAEQLGHTKATILSSSLVKLLSIDQIFAQQQPVILHHDSVAQPLIRATAYWESLGRS